MTIADAGLLPLAHLPVEAQLRAREARVAEALGRGRVRAEPRPIVPSPLPHAARARLKLRAGPEGRLGFHRPNTHDWVRVELASMARPEIVAEAERIEAWGGARGEVELRTDGARVAAVFLGDAREVPPRLRQLGGNVFGAGRVHAGDPTLHVDGLRISPLSFFQVNLEINARIVADVDEVLRELAPARLLDLYAGVGNLSARAVRRGVPATLVELDRSSASDARVNAPGAEIVVGDAAKLPTGKHFFDVALLDPPRAGAPGVLQRLCVTRPRAILYLSCDPSTLARDIAPIVNAGYAIERIQPYDMFPDTEHVETLAVLVRA